MSEVFSSTALEANLTQTREEVIQIPEMQKWFGELSRSKWGIYKRTEDFLTELNHKYRNDQYVIDALHSICLEDLWFYNSLEDSEKALGVLVDIIQTLFKSEMEDSQRELLIKTLIKFMDRLANLGEFPKSIIFKCIDIIKSDMAQNELLYIRNSGYFKTYLNKVIQFPEFTQSIMAITSELLSKTIDYWDETSKAEEWYSSRRQLFHSLSKKQIKEIGHSFFQQLREEREQATDFGMLSNLMFYNDISNYFRNFTDKIDSYLESIYYIYYLLHLPGMSHLNDHLLYDMNRNLRNVFKELGTEDIYDFINTIMAEFKDLQEDHSGTVLDCIITLGKEVIDTKDISSISHFTKSLIKLGFNHPGKLSLNKDWQIQINTNHVKNIRVWLELIEHAPSTMRELLAALIVNLKLGGIFISDTDLFQRDITKLLNSEITPVYREIKQLAKIFPVYFRDIGAEGELRETTTAIDEISLRKDRLIHFLRKQVHTESNNTHIILTQSLIQYWYNGDKEPLKNIVPQEIYDTLDTDEGWFQRPHEIMQALCKHLDSNPEMLMQADIDEIKQGLDHINVGTTKEKSRVLYLFWIYSLLLEKYSLESDDILSMLKSYSFFNSDDLSRLQQDLESNHNIDAIRQIYKLMKHLKSIILDPKESEALENIYYKRHIAVGIPSMYGQYIEPKFDALGLMYRLERTVTKLINQVLTPFHTEYITAKTFRQIYDILVLFKDGLELDGIYNQGFNSHLDMFKYGLASPSFSLDQYINIFHFMAQDIGQMINEYFRNVFERSMLVIIPQIGITNNVPAVGENSRQVYHIEAEKFLRDNLSSAFLVQDLDNFITDIINTLRSMIDNYSDSIIENMMTYDPDLTFSLLSKKTEEVDNPVFLGAKAFFLKKLIGYGFPIPPGFVITTEVFRHLNTISGHPYMKQDFDRHIENYIKAIEEHTGQNYGKPQNPLFFSIRSGSSISMPGAMKTFLNVGMNDEIAEAFSKKKGYDWTAWDCYRRFLQSWGMAYGIERDVFDGVMLEHKERRGVALKIQFTSEHMRELAFAYKSVLLDYNIKIEEDPYKQLNQAIRRVLDSWSSQSAVSYRNHMQIADEWGTAVIVQKMILGNVSSNSGTGVVFTNSPFNGYSGINLYGDFALCSQGEDVVSGLVNTLPISEDQRKKHYSESSLSLESGFPQIYNALISYAKQLIEQHGFVHQEIEFTFESERVEDLYILQTRNQKLKKQQSYSSFVPAPYEMKMVGHGIGVSSGVLSGLLAFDMSDMKQLQEKDPDAKIILVRPDTVPDDIPLIFICDGLVTGKGGVTSHAAVTAAGLGKVCIVKCGGLQVNDLEKKCTINGHTFVSGDRISIDGSLGNIYEGNYEIH